MLYQEGVRGGLRQGRRAPFSLSGALGSEDTSETGGQMGTKGWGGGSKNGGSVGKLRSPLTDQ